MKLGKLSLANYRAFDQIELSFQTDMTVIAGVNGVGKSAILEAIAKAMSLVLPEMTPSKERPLRLSDTDIKYGKTNLTLSANFKTTEAVINAGVTRSLSIDVEEAKKLTKRRDELRSIKARDKKEAQEIEYKLDYIDDRLKPAKDIPNVVIAPHDPKMMVANFLAESKSGETHPLAVFYTTSRFFTRYFNTVNNEKLDIAQAYNNSLDQFEVSLKDFANWYRVVKEGKNTRMLKQLDTAISNFLPDVKNLDLILEKRPKITVQKNGSTLILQQLSDGERGLLALVFDLTRRLATANPGSKNPIAEGEGIVIIDEIELHLHPKWQRDVIHALRRTFKNCQFIITTHSPFVIQSLEQGQLRRLGPNGQELGEYENQPIEDIIEFIQEVEAPQIGTRAIELNRATKEYFSLLQDPDAEAEKLVEAEARYRATAKYYSANPGLSALLELKALARKEAKK